MMLDELGRRIRAQREKRGLKQQDVANALRLSPQAVSKWERGENAPDIAVLAQLANLLGVTTDWLLSTGGRPDVLEATVFVSSVQGAYGKSRCLKPRDFATWANGLFYVLTEVTLRNGAVPIKYMGDQYLCFFSGASHQGRALEAALAASSVVAEDLRIALGSGEIYLGAMGHPDYARPDIMGEVVNVTFLALGWAEGEKEEKEAEGAEGAKGAKGAKERSGVVATLPVIEGAGAAGRVGRRQQVSFRGVTTPVTICEVLRAAA